MHMSDALLSPMVGVVCIGAAAACTAVSLAKIRQEESTIRYNTATIPALSGRIPLMGIMAAFVFAAQMINFTIPGTGSSGHIGGGLLLAAILGPWAGFLSMASVLLIQAFFFADGGLLALGTNILNMGFFTCVLAYPLLLRPMIGRKAGSTPAHKRILFSSIVSVVLALQLGAFSVVVQTVLSGKTSLPFGTFLLYMQPIHLVIGIVEGFVTAAVLGFVMQYQPGLLHFAAEEQSLETAKTNQRWVPVLFISLALIIGGVFSWYASEYPDGLEWSIEKTAGSSALEAESSAHDALAALQNNTALLPDYGFRNGSKESAHLGTSVSGLVGIALTIVLMVLLGAGLRLLRKKLPS